MFANKKGRIVSYVEVSILTIGLCLFIHHYSYPAYRIRDSFLCKSKYTYYWSLSFSSFIIPNPPGPSAYVRIVGDKGKAKLTFYMTLFKDLLFPHYHIIKLHHPPYIWTSPMLQFWHVTSYIWTPPPPPMLNYATILTCDLMYFKRKALSGLVGILDS